MTPSPHSPAVPGQEGWEAAAFPDVTGPAAPRGLIPVSPRSGPAQEKAPCPGSSPRLASGASKATAVPLRGGHQTHQGWSPQLCWPCSTRDACPPTPREGRTPGIAVLPDGRGWGGEEEETNPRGSPGPATDVQALTSSGWTGAVPSGARQGSQTTTARVRVSHRGAFLAEIFGDWGGLCPWIPRPGKASSALWKEGPRWGQDQEYLFVL